MTLDNQLERRKGNLSPQKVVFSGLEIERVIEFIRMLDGRPSSQLLMIESAVVRGYASILKDDESDLQPAKMTFIAAPDYIDQAYRRAVRFRYKLESGGDLIYTFGGRNAIREEWRLRDATFFVAFPEGDSSPEPMDRLLDTIFPDADDQTKYDTAAVDESFFWCRRILLGLSSELDLSAVQEIARSKIWTVLTRDRLPPTQAMRAIQLAEDIGDKHLLSNLVTWESKIAKSAKPFLGRILRRLFDGFDLNGSTNLAQYYRQLVKESFDDVWSLLREVETPYPPDNAHFLQAMEFLEALSFVSRMDGESAKLLLELMKGICKKSHALRAHKSGLGQALLASSMLAFAQISKRNSVLFGPHGADDGSILTSFLEISALPDAPLSDKDFPTLRMAAMASVAQLIENTTGMFAQVVSQAQDRIDLNASQRQHIARREDIETDYLNRADEICVCADSLARLFSIHRASRSDAAVQAYGTIVRIWADTTEREIRRATAKAIVEALCHRFSIDWVVSLLADNTYANPGSIRSVCLEGTTEGASQFLVTDFPTLVVVSAAERFSELSLLAFNLAPEYKPHVEWQSMIEFLLKYAEAEIAYTNGNVPRALAAYKSSLQLLEPFAAPTATIDKNIVQALAFGCAGRSALCSLTNGVERAEVGLDKAISYYGVAKSCSSTSPASTGSDVHYPDYELAGSIELVLSGIKATGALSHSSDLVWRAAMSVPFSQSLEASTYCESANWRTFVAKHIVEMADRSNRRADDVPHGVLPPLPPSVEHWVVAATDEWLVQPLLRRWHGSRRAKYFVNVQKLPEKWGKYSVRPIGLLAYGRGLHW